MTSGIYERCFLDKATGTVHHHILDPKTGRPCESDLASATVLSRTSIEGDGLSTALVIMGRDRAAAFIREKTDAAAIFIRRDGSAAVAGNEEILKETRAIEIPGAEIIN